MKPLRIFGILSLVALVAICFVSYNTTYYLRPSETEVNNVMPEMFVLYPSIYEGKRVAFTMRVIDVRSEGGGLLIKGSSDYGDFVVYYGDAGVSKDLYRDLRVTVSGISRLSTLGYIEADVLHPEPYILAVNILAFFGLVFLVAYTCPLWNKRLRGLKIA